MCGICVVEGSHPRMIFDRTVTIKQLNVVEAHGLLVFRADKGECDSSDSMKECELCSECHYWV